MTDDPIRRYVEKNVQDELSPMDPPDAYAPPGKVDVAVKDMHPFLQELIEEHTAIKAALEKFEETILSIREKGIARDTNERLGEFFNFFNDGFMEHDRREEKYLFPHLAAKLIENGEHSHGPAPTTAVDVMESDHLKMIQLTAVIFNFFGLASRLRDDRSRCQVLDAALEQAQELIEIFRLHIFREDTILFPLAHKYIDSSELTRLQNLGRPRVQN